MGYEGFESVGVPACHAGLSPVLTTTVHNEQPTSTDTHTQDAQRNPSDFVKPIFLIDQDAHGSVKPPEHNGWQMHPQKGGCSSPLCGSYLVVA
jgi:hypothetical protein